MTTTLTPRRAVEDSTTLIPKKLGRSRPLFDPEILRRAAKDSFAKLNPVTLMKNPVIFVVEVGAALTTVFLIRDAFIGAANLVFEPRRAVPTGGGDDGRQIGLGRNGQTGALGRGHDDDPVPVAGPLLREGVHVREGDAGQEPDVHVMFPGDAGDRLVEQEVADVLLGEGL